MRLPIILALAASCSVGWAADRYVSGSGVDSHDGLSVGGAYRTLAKAATVVNPGDTVWILNGTYAPFTLSRSGSAGAPITWKAYAGHAPELVSNAWNAISVDASYQIIDGLILTGNNDNVTLAQAEADYDAATPSGLYNGNGILLDNRSKATPHHHLTVRNCTVRKFCGGGIATIQADYTVIEHCDIYENAWYSRYGCSGATIFPANADSGTGYRNIIRGNRLWHNCGLVKWKQILDYSDGNGLILDVHATDYSGRTLVCDNLSVNNGGSGIHAFKGIHADIVNNTAYMNGWKVGYADIFAGYSTDIVMKDNVVYSRVGGKANTNGNNNAGVVYDYNVYFNGTRAVTGAHDVVGDPLFVNPGLDPLTADFRLLSGSPARDTALTVAGMTSTSDILGVSRPRGAGLDRGAYEFIPAPAVTSQLTASGIVAVPLNYQITGSNLPTSFNATGLPGGLTVNTASGLIHGTPTASGTFSVTISVDNGGGTASATLVLTIAPIDTTPPARPSAPTSSSSTSATPTLSGTAEANATIRIYDGSTLLGTVVADGSGAWSFVVSPALPAGSHALTVTATDASSNTSAASDATVVSVTASGSSGGSGSGGGCGSGSAFAILLGSFGCLAALRGRRSAGRG